MFRKYEKTFRIVTPDINVPGKFSLDKDEVKHLLNGTVYVEEKMDGANVGIIRHKTGFHLQKRGSLVGASEHDQFQYFHNWANVQNYEKIMALPVGIILYGELVRCRHTVYYDKLPDYFLAFAAYDKKGGKWLDYEERSELCTKLGFSQVPLIATESGLTLSELSSLIPTISKYGSEPAEGIVFKRYRKGEMLKGKLVREEFIKHMEENEHWMHQGIVYNKLAL